MNNIPLILLHQSVIEQMIQLRTQLAQLSQQIQELEPSFYQACDTLNTEKITFPQAIISRRLTPGQWLYSPDILTLEQELKRLKQQFRQTHEPSSGSRNHLGYQTATQRPLVDNAPSL